jgi:hypothetical protein
MAAPELIGSGVVAEPAVQPERAPALINAREHLNREDERIRCAQV